MAAWAAAALAALALAGCSAVRFSYNQAPEFGFWWLDNHVGFNEAQAPVAREALGDWFAWHRRTQLPDYASLLERARAEVLAPITPEQACRWLDEGQVRLNKAVDRAIPAGAQVLESLSPQQLDAWQKRLDKRNAEFREEFMQPDPKRRLKASIERTVDRFEWLYGRIEPSQRAAIERGVQASPFEAERWMAERERRQRELMQALRRADAAPNAGEASIAALQRFVATQLRSDDPTYRAYQQRVRAANCVLAAEVHNAASPAQRTAAAQRLKGWETDLRALAASATPAPPVASTGSALQAQGLSGTSTRSLP